MILFHGSTVQVKKPQIIPAEIGRDFGHGFYTTNIRQQAVKWAERKSRIERMRGIDSLPILNVYELDWQKAANRLNIKIFGDQATLEWLDFVIQCRQNNGFTHNFDIVVGNIADDNVGETVSFVQLGIMRREDALDRLRFETINNQICFNTPAALSYLCFVRFEVISR